jgi:2,4'-dihydroxyacetophenone dioxygenase
MSNAPIPVSEGIRPEIAVAAMPDDERVRVPQAPDVWFPARRERQG